MEAARTLPLDVSLSRICEACSRRGADSPTSSGFPGLRVRSFGVSQARPINVGREVKDNATIAPRAVGVAWKWLNILGSRIGLQGCAYYIIAIDSCFHSKWRS